MEDGFDRIARIHRIEEDQKAVYMGDKPDLYITF